MNKKVSTLVAALMAAGALVLPKDVFAQVAFANGKAYADQVSATAEAGKNYYLVFEEGGKNYVAVVAADNSLVAKEFSAATKADMITISEATPAQTGWWSLSSNGVYLGLDNASNANDFGTQTNIYGVFEKDAVKLWATQNGYISRDGLTFKVVSTNNTSGETRQAFNATLVSENSLIAEKTPVTPMSNSTKVSEGQAVILMYGDEVLAWDAANKKAKLVPYNAEKPELWYLDIETVKNVAYLKNADGQYLLQDGTTDQYAVEIPLKKSGDYYVIKTGSWSSVAISNVSVAPTDKISIAAVPERPTVVSDLNKWYNGKGFNFAVDGEDVKGNLFGGDKVIFSITSNGKDAKVGNAYVPAGTYFFTDAKFLNGKGASNATPEDIDWLNSTIIALSSSVANEATDDDRAAGKGFELVEVLGKDFDFQANSETPQGNDIAIQNAAFSVSTKAGEAYPYALSLKSFFYQAKGSSNEKEDQKEIKNVKLGVESYTVDGVATNVLVSQVSSNNYIFKFTNSAVLNTRTLLNETKEAAVYTIKFVKGLSGQAKLMNKYLTVGLGSGDFQYEAKPVAIFDATMPIFQWVITNVSDVEVNSEGEKEYKEVTFTNRETNESFTTQLFKEADGLYSMSKSLENVVSFTVESGAQNTYETTVDGKFTTNANVLIQLDKVKVTENDGFFNDGNDLIKTIAFARDKYNTSNRLFATVGSVNESVNGGYNTYRYLTEMSNDIADAAQWKLVKVGEKSISRTYVYNNTTTQSADEVVDGDKLKATVYRLRLIEDGTETPFALADYSYYQVINGKRYDKLLQAYTYADATNLIIKQNIDGSVSILDADVSMENDKVAAADVNKALDADKWSADCNYVYGESVYSSTSYTNDVRLYLDDERKEISWPAEAGHITLLSEMSNYVNMNANNEAIEVAEKDANSYYLHVTDKKAVVPSFYLSLGKGEGSNASSERMFMFNPVDSVNYYVADGAYDTKYQWAENRTKLMFKAATMNETADTLTTTIKGEVKKVAMKADNDDKNVLGGLKRFKFQIVETPDADGYYYIRQTDANNWGTSQYLGSINSKMTFVSKDQAMKFHIESVEAPTSNEGVAASEVKVVAQDGAVVVKNAAGKNVVVSTILGQVVANEVLTSDNATINVPAGIVVVAVEGESFKVNVK